VVMHIYWHHWEHIVMRDCDVLLNNYTKHFIVFALKHKLVVRFDAVAPIFDLLGTILPPNYHKQLQDMEKKAKGGGAKPAPKKVKEKKPVKGRGRRAVLGRGALNKMKQQGELVVGDDFDFEDEKGENGDAERQAKEKEEKGKEGKEDEEEARRKKEEEEERAADREKRFSGRSPSVVQIPLEVLNSFTALSDPALPSPTVFVRRGSSERNQLPSLPPTFNPEAALNRLYAREGAREDNEEAAGDGDELESKEGSLEALTKPGARTHYRASAYLTQEELEEFMRLKEDERREWVKRKQQLPHTLSDNKVRYEAMGPKQNK